MRRSVGSCIGSRVCAASSPFRQVSASLLALDGAQLRPWPSAGGWLSGRGGGAGRPSGAPATLAPTLGCRQQLRCTARRIFSRDSLDEEQIEVLLPQSQQNSMPAVGNGTARAGQRQQQREAGGTSLQLPQQQQQPQRSIEPSQGAACTDDWPPRQLSIKELQQLTELHVEDAYGSGMVSCAAELAACLGSDLADGLCESQAELEERAQQYGRNSVRPPKAVTFWELVLEALQDFTILVLLGAGCLSLGLEVLVQNKSGGESSWIEGASILAAVSVVVLVTAVNNYQKERQFRMLQAVSADVKVRAIRNGREQALPVAEVVVGDLLLVETGDILCTDGMLVAGCDVKVDESHLTGESDDVAKDALTRPSLLGGSKVLSGFGRMLVTAVGPFSQSGAIAEMVADGKAWPAAATGGGAGDGLREETLLQQKLAEYANSIGRFGLGAAALATVAMTLRFSMDTFLLQRQPWDWAFLQDYLRFFITGVTILVVAVPEGLPLAVTLALAFSVRRMLADNNLVRHLSAAEMMGTATVVCSDKTGTLTQNDMVVSKLWLAGHLLPDIKPYTRHEQRSGSEQRLWLAALGRGASSASASASITGAGGRANIGGAGEGLPTLAELLVSRSSVAALGGSTSLENDSTSCRTMANVTPGSSTPADIVQLLVESAALNSTANIIKEKDGTKRSIGNHTEIALLELAVLLGGHPRRLRRQQRQLVQVAFSSERKRMSTASLPPGTGFAPDGSALCRIYTKGASEIVLDRCSYVLGPDGTRRQLLEEEKAPLLENFTQGGQRVLCLAYRDVTLPPEVLLAPGGGTPRGGEGSSGEEGGGAARFAALGGDPNGWLWDTSSNINAWMSSSESDGALWDDSLCLADNLESNLTLLALVGIEDPLREEVPAAILQCQASGITVKMLTGDNVGTATAIARECGILPPVGISMEDWGAAREAAHKASYEAAARSGTAPWFRSPSSSSIVAAPKASDGLPPSLNSGSLDKARVAPGGRPGAEAGWHGELPTGVVMEGQEFRERVLNADGSIRAKEFLELWPTLRVLARCSPADKYTIVTGVRSLTNDVVAVTGDGTNDAPALRAANVGFAMNVGTDTAKEAADIVLLDNNFASIVSAVLWGRNVYANITRFLQFQLTINLVAVATAVTGAVVATESPLIAVQMLWVNMIMDSLASLALATEPPDPRILSIPPFSQEHEFVDPRTPTVKHIMGQAAYQLLVMYGLIFYAPALLGIPDHSEVTGPSVHYTLVFNTFVFMQLFNQMNARKILDSSHAWEGLGAARWFQWILGSELLLQILIVQFGGEWFNTHPLGTREWAVCVGLGVTTLALREILVRLPYGRFSEYGS